ncbi:Cytochrome p450 [Thalictrum thalictroides]|uniref:Cytochrome p450 n=1 Tax=Thalictrum thalictroides TaxID=46969 RepID=A0A7J6UZS4_THATH|nr:Cytochrome p450 [Thalictrum thalictroides]
MEFLVYVTAICSGLLASIYILYIIISRKTNAKIRTAPEPAGAWPLIGHLPMLSEPRIPHIVLGDLADKYGPVFTIRFGLHKALVVSSWEVAKECFTTNDKALASRPTSVAIKIMTYNGALFGFSPYGTYWRQARKVAVLELLSNNRLELLKHVRSSEVSTSIKELYQVWQQNCNSEIGSALVEMKSWFTDLTLNVIVRMVAGKRYFGSSVKLDNGEGKRLQKAIQRDPRVWSNPSEFQPERFLTTHANVDLGGKHFEFIPFGSGRRSCPGVSFALHVVHLTLARLLQSFDFETPSNAAVDMTESAGLSNPKATPLEVLITPRLVSSLY